MTFEEHVPLAPYTSFRIGGPARFFCIAKSGEELQEAINKAKELGVPYYLLGGGTNVLISDKGFRGLVIKVELRKAVVRDGAIDAEAGIPMPQLANLTAQAGLSGLEWAVGVPGTVGGSIRGNAGAFGGDTKGYVTDVEVLEVKDSNAHTKHLTNPDCHFAYRSSVFKEHPEWIITRGTFQLAQGDEATIRGKMRTFMERRKATQGLERPSAGCVFKNSYLKDGKGWFDELKTRLEVDDALFGELAADGRIPASFLIDRVGLKGKRIGGAQISLVHGNFILNTGSATAEEVIILISLIKERVRTHYGIELREEIEYVGF